MVVEKMKTWFCAGQPILTLDDPGAGKFVAPHLLNESLVGVVCTHDGPVEVFEIQIKSLGFFKRRMDIEKCEPPPVAEVARFDDDEDDEDDEYY